MYKNVHKKYAVTILNFLILTNISTIQRELLVYGIKKTDTLGDRRSSHMKNIQYIDLY